MLNKNDRPSDEVEQPDSTTGSGHSGESQTLAEPSGLGCGAQTAQDAKRQAAHLRMLAKWEALNECAGHLELSWTDDPVEYSEGIKLAARLRRQADKWLERSRIAAKRAIAREDAK